MIFNNMKYIFITILLISSFTNAKSLIDKYPAYNYVLSEFDIETGYIYDYEFEEFVTKNEKKLLRFYNHSIARGDYFIPIIKNGLLNNNLSDLLVYLSIVESGLKSDIKSHKKAVGLWQFMPSTAKHYNLEVDKCFDDRCDPYLATKAAIKHLKHLYHKFGAWYLAIIAYNCGEGRLAKAIKKAKTDDLRTLIDNDTKLLPKETRDYIRKIILLAMIGESSNISFDKTYPNLVKVEVGGGTNLKTIAKLIDMSYKKLLQINGKYKKGKIPTQKYSYEIFIPESKMVTFYKNYLLPPRIIQKHLLVSYHVKLGDTLETIAKKFHTSIEDIKLTNNITDDFLTLDQLLVIPTD